jgi:hypothetical protein
MSDPNITVTPASTLTDPEMAALISKHRTQIDPILRLDIETQQQAVSALGIDTQALEEYYKSLSAKSAELKTRDKAASTNIVITGWASLAAAAVGVYAVRKKIAKSKLVQAFSTALAGLAAGVGGTYLGTRIFAGKVREESAQLAGEARDVLERELAVALENKERSEAAAAATGQTPATVPLEKAFSKIPARDPSYVKQSVADKAEQDKLIQQCS